MKTTNGKQKRKTGNKTNITAKNENKTGITNENQKSLIKNKNDGTKNRK